MTKPRQILPLFKPTTRMTQVLVEELHRCWARLDGRASTIRRLARENRRQRVKLANRGVFIVELWQGMEAARRWIRGEFRDGPLGDPASKSWACLWCGEMLTGREHAKQHCEICPESPLVHRIQTLEQQLRDPGAPWNNA